MSNFKKNTVETVGDAALAESIINRSLNELQDNITTSIAAQKFRGCSALANVIFPSVTSVGIGAFWQCTALKQADFEACVSFAQNAFYGCSALAALILRCTDAVCTLTGNLSGTPIATGTGYIYVPLALVDTYKAAIGWSTYAAQIRAIEDYPEVCNMYTWEAVFKAIDAGTYKDVYKVGDLVPLDLGSEGVVNMQIAGFDVDALSDGSGTAPISWISNELLLTSHRMNPALVTNDDGTYQEGTSTIGGWEKCEMRAYLNDTIKPLIPEEVRNSIVAVTKTQPAYDTSGSSFTQTTEDDVWIPSKDEVYGGTSKYYELFQDTTDNRKKKKSGDTYNNGWWLRSTYDSNKFNFVSSYGEVQAGTVGSSFFVALGFCT